MTSGVPVGLNVGMSMYKAWHPVFSASHTLTIPFAITEFTRMSLVEDFVESFKDGARSNGLSEMLGREKMEVLVKSLDHPPCSAINPFMRPGHKGAQTNNMPTAVIFFPVLSRHVLKSQI